MKRYVLILMSLLTAVAVNAACDLTLQYYGMSLMDDSLRVKAVLVAPDREVKVLCDATQKALIKTMLLEQRGDYQLELTIQINEYIDSTTRVISIDSTMKSVSIDLDVRTQDDVEEPISVGVRLIKALTSSPLVTIEYLGYHTGEDGEYPGPFFTITNKSQNTLYGEHLPGYFWGWVSYLFENKAVRKKGGRICTTFDDRPPIYPGMKGQAYVGSFGCKLQAGKYRFTVFYAVNGWPIRAIPNIKKTASMVWYFSEENWYVLDCDFVVE